MIKNNNSSSTSNNTTSNVVKSNNQEETAKSILISFIIMSLFFSINHGTVVACIPLASGEFGSTLGSYSLGSLYLVYTLTAMLFATSILKKFGIKWTLVLGLWVYCFYVASYLVARAFPSTKWITVMIGAMLGGGAAGFLWPAQGGYFSNCAKHYAILSNIPVQDATSYMSGIFATLYLGFELIFKILSSLLQVFVCSDDWKGDFITGSCENDDKKTKAETLVFIIYTIAAVASAIAMCFIRNIASPDEDLLLLNERGSLTNGLLNDEDNNNDNNSYDEDNNNGSKTVVSVPTTSTSMDKWYGKALTTIHYLLSNRKMQLMVLVNVEFGFIAAYLNSHVTGSVIPNGLGEGKVGYLTSIIPIVATAVSMPISWITNQLQTKRYTMVFGSSCFLIFGLFSLLCKDSFLGQWGILVPLFIIYGFGRAVWEGPNKAVFADFFPDNPQAAFANIVLQNGTATTLAFFIFPNLSPVVMEIIIVVVGGCAVVSYLTADTLYSLEQKKRMNNRGFSEENAI